MSEIESALRDLEEKLLRADLRRDTDFLRSVLAEEFREFGSSGRIFDKATTIELLAAETYGGFSLSEFKALPVNRHAVLVTYRAQESGSDTSAAAASLRSSVWVWREGRWQMLFHQGTRAAGKLADCR